MTAIIEFKTAIKAAMFQSNICGNAKYYWSIWKPINDTDKILRVLSFGDEPQDESFYKYLRGLGAFKEVEFK